MSTTTLTDSAAAVQALGASQAEIELLDDASLRGGMRLVAEHELELQRYKLWLAASIARRSDHTLGYDGLARKNGFPTPAAFIQSITGTSLDEAGKLARLGTMIVEAESAPPSTADGPGGSGSSALATAVTAGGIAVDAAEAIRKGLGRPDAAVTDQQLRVAAEKLIARANTAAVLGSVTPEALLKLARQARNELDVAAIEAGQKQRADARYVRIWSRDGISGGSWALPDEDGGIETHTALKLLLARHTGGPRFPETDANGEPITKTSAEQAIDDTRSMDQILADGFAQIFHNGIAADPTVVPGAGRAAVRVVVAERVLETNPEPAGDGSTKRAGSTGSALLEENLTAITFTKLEEYLCEGGTIAITLRHDGTIDVGREQRLFTRRQRTALGVRDGGCRFPGCDKPPSWTEAHHIQYWDRDEGKTDLQNGILLCRYHTMFIHNSGWQIGRDHGGYWLKPPQHVDPEQRLIEMPSKNPLIATFQRAQAAAV